MRRERIPDALEATGDLAAPLQVPGLLEHVQVIPNAVRGGDAELLADFANGRRIASLLLKSMDEGEDLARSLVQHGRDSFLGSEWNLALANHSARTCTASIHFFLSRACARAPHRG